MLSGIRHIGPLATGLFHLASCLRFICAVACIRISFIFTVYTTIFHDGNLGCFCFSAAIYNTAVNKIANGKKKKKQIV